MEQNILEKQRDLNDRLNRYRDEYYNRNANFTLPELADFPSVPAFICY